jgi:hypothetical protein
VAAGDLATVQQVKDWLGITNATSDNLLGDLVTRASTWITSYLSRPILRASYVEVYRGNGQDNLLLRQGPISAVASVAWVGTTVTAAADPTTLSQGIRFDDQLLTVQGYCLPRGLPIQVSYTAGYASTPADITQACVELVGEAFKRRDRIGQNSKTLGGQEVISFSTKDMSEPTRTALNSYRAVAPI